MDRHSGVGESSLEAADLRRIDALCDEFEEAGPDAEGPTIEGLVGRVEERLRPVLLRYLLEIEIRKQGTAEFEARSEAYRKLFAEADAIVESLLASAFRTTALESASIHTTSTMTSNGDSNPPREPPQTIGRFEIEAELGRGGFGAVYRAYDTVLKRTVALKVPLAGTMSADERRRFQREAESAARLHHPHIVPVFDVETTDEICWISSAYIEGRSLRSKLAQGERPSIDDSVALVIKLANALHYAHLKGIVHRDVTPGNILLDSKGEPHLTDFGLAFFSESEFAASRADASTACGLPVGSTLQTQAGMIVGTPAYMSPEQASGQVRATDARSDLWSLGVVFYQLLSGRSPFDGDDVREILGNVLRTAPPRLEKIAQHVPRDLQAVCHKCLEKEPRRRFQTCDELEEELRRWVRGEPVESRRIGVIERAARRCRRHPVTSALAAVATLLLAATVTSIAVGYRETTRALAEAEGQRNAAQERGRELQASEARTQQEFELSEQKSYAQLIDLSRQYLNDGEAELAWRTLIRCPLLRRGWEFRHLEERILGEAGNTLEPGREVAAAALSPNGRMLAAMYLDGKVDIFNADGGQVLLSLPNSALRQEKPDGKERRGPDLGGLEHGGAGATLIYVPFADEVLLGCLGNKVVVWDTVTGQPRFSWDAPHPVTCAAYSLGQDRFVVGDAQGGVHLLDYRGRKAETIRRPGDTRQNDAKPPAEAGPEAKGKRGVVSLAGGARLAVQTEESLIEFWDLETRAIVSESRLKDSIVAHGWCDDRWCAILKNGEFLVGDADLKQSPRVEGGLESRLTPQEYSAARFDFVAGFDGWGEYLFVSDRSSRLHVFEVKPHNGGWLRRIRSIAVPNYVTAVAPSSERRRPSCALITRDLSDTRIEIRRAVRYAPFVSSMESKVRLLEQREFARIRPSADGRFIVTPWDIAYDSQGIRGNRPIADFMDESRRLSELSGEIGFGDHQTTRRLISDEADYECLSFTGSSALNSVTLRRVGDRCEIQYLLNGEYLDSIPYGISDPSQCEVVFSPDGEWFVTRSATAAWLWDRSRSTPVRELPLETRIDTGFLEFLPLEFSPDGRTVAVATQANQIRLVNCTTMDEPIVFESVDSRGRIYGMALLPAGNRMVTTGMDGSLKVWDVRTRQVVATIPGEFIGKPGVSFDGSTIAALAATGNIGVFRAPPPRLQSAVATEQGLQVLRENPDETITLAHARGLDRWSLRTGEMTKIFEFSGELPKDSRWITDVVGETALAYEDGGRKAVLLRSLGSGRPEVTQLEIPDERVICAAALDSTGRRVALGTMPADKTPRGRFHVWDIEKRQFVVQQDTSEPFSIVYGGREIFVYQGGSLACWDVETPAYRNESTLNRNFYYDGGHSYRSHDGTRLICLTREGIEIRSTDTLGIEIGVFEKSRALAAALCQDDQLLATGHEDGTVRLWHLRTMAMIDKWSAHSDGVLSLRFLADGRLATTSRKEAAVWYADPGAVASRKPWDALSLEERIAKMDGLTAPRSIVEHTDVVVSFDCDRTGSRLISADRGGRILCRNLREPTRSAVEFECGYAFPAVAISGDGARAAFGSDEEGRVTIVDPRTGERLREVTIGRRPTLRLNADGSLLAAAMLHFPPHDADYRTVFGVWNANSGEKLWSVTEIGSRYCELKIDSDRGRLRTYTAKGGVDGDNADEYELATGTRIKRPIRPKIAFPLSRTDAEQRDDFETALRHRTVIGDLLEEPGDHSFLDLHPDGRHLLIETSAFDAEKKEIVILDLATGRRVWSALFDGDWMMELAARARFTADGKTIIAADRNGMLWIWETPLRILNPTNSYPNEETEVPIAGDDGLLADHAKMLRHFTNQARQEVWEACYAAIALAEANPEGAIDRLKEANGRVNPELLTTDANELIDMLRHVERQIEASWELRRIEEAVKEMAAPGAAPAPKGAEPTRPEAVNPFDVPEKPPTRSDSESGAYSGKPSSSMPPNPFGPPEAAGSSAPDRPTPPSPAIPKATQRSATGPTTTKPRVETRATSPTASPTATAVPMRN